MAEQMWPGDPRPWVARETAEHGVLLAEQRGAEMMLRALGVHSQVGAVELSEMGDRMIHLSQVNARMSDVRETWEVLMGQRDCPDRYDDGRCLVCGRDESGNAVRL